MRYRRAVPYGQLLCVRASLGSERGRMLQASGIVTFAHDESVVLAEGQGTFMSLSSDMVDTIFQDYPGLKAFFEEE